MRKLNGRRFENSNPLQQPRVNEPCPTSGESPRLWQQPEAPQVTSAAFSFSRKIVLAKPPDVKFLIHLQKKFSNALGFLPTTALNWYVENKRVGIGYENGEPAGYVLGRAGYKSNPDLRPICQTAVAMDAQRRRLGLELVARVIIHAQEAGQLAVQAVCAEDLDSNEFWAAAEFQAIGVMTPKNARGRKLICWRKVTTEVTPPWFYTLPDEPGQRRRRR